MILKTSSQILKIHTKDNIVVALCDLNKGFSSQRFLADFFSDKLYQGTETVLFTNSGIEIISNYEKGISTVVNRNDINSFKAEDVVGDTEFIEVSLLQRGTVVDSRLAYDVELEINGVKGEWLLDSGAMGFTIGNIMFERLIANGINYKDLNKIVK